MLFIQPYLENVINQFVTRFREILQSGRKDFYTVFSES
jgi:hypothetical protein